MTTYYWKGSTTPPRWDDLDLNTNYVPTGLPTSGDTLIIDTNVVTVHHYPSQGISYAGIVNFPSSGEINGGTYNGVFTNTGGSINNGIFNGIFYNYWVIYDGTFNNSFIHNASVIVGGTFNGSVDNNSDISWLGGPSPTFIGFVDNFDGSIYNGTFNQTRSETTGLVFGGTFLPESSSASSLSSLSSVSSISSLSSSSPSSMSSSSLSSSLSSLSPLSVSSLSSLSSSSGSSLSNISSLSSMSSFSSFSSSSSSFSSQSSLSSSSSSSSTQESLTSSTSEEELLDKIGGLLFAGNDGIIKAKLNQEGWTRVNDNKCDNSNVVVDSRNPFIWVYSDLDKQIYQTKIANGSDTGKYLNNVEGCKTLPISPISGNVFVLSNKEKIALNTYIYGGILTYYSYSNDIGGSITPTYNGNSYNLFGSMDVFLDYIRKRMWVADTLNHKIISINAETNEIDYILSSSDYVFPSSITVDVSSGTTFVRAYSSSTLEELILIIKNNSIFSVFKSPGVLGFKNVYNPNNGIVAIDYDGTQSYTYGINSEYGNIEITYDTQKQNTILLSNECLNNTFVSYNKTGTMKFFTNEGNDLGEITIDIDNRFKIIPSIFDASYWAYVYRGNAKYNLTKIRATNKNKISIETGTADFYYPTAGSLIIGERRPIILSDNGKTILKLSNDANIIEKRKTLSLNHDLIDTHIKDNVIIIGKKEKIYFKTLDSNLSQEQDYDFVFAEEVLDISVVQNASNYYWILCNHNDLFKARCEGGIITILGGLHIPSSNQITGVKHNYRNGGAIVFSMNEIYSISQDGNTIVWRNSSFNQIMDVGVVQDISTVFTTQFQYDLFSSNSMAFDGFRNKFWWLSQNLIPKMSMLDLNDYSTDITDIELSNVYFEYGSSSSS